MKVGDYINLRIEIVEREKGVLASKMDLTGRGFNEQEVLGYLAITQNDMLENIKNGVEPKRIDDDASKSS